MIVNRQGRHPHEVYLLAVCVLYGLAGLIAYDKVVSNSIQPLGPLAGHLFFGSVLFGSAVALLGIFWPFKGLQGPLVERSGLLILAAFWIGYTVAVAYNAGIRGLGFILVVGGFALANVHRAVWDIPRGNKRIASAAAATGVLDQLRDESP